MPGMIGVISDHAARYTWFSQSLHAVAEQHDATVEWRIGANRGTNRDALARACLDQDCDWLFFVDDDQAFPADTIAKLLRHHLPVVSALIVQRAKPFLPTVYATQHHNEFQPLDLASVGSQSLVRCAGVGSGGLLVRSDVFRQLDDGRPWFLYTEAYGEDLYFSDRCHEAGIEMFVDTDCRVGHIIPAAVFPTWVEGRWVLGIQLADGTGTAIELNHNRKEP